MRSVSSADALGSSGAVWLLVVRFLGLAVGAAGWLTGCCSSVMKVGHDVVLGWRRSRMLAKASKQTLAVPKLF